MRKFLVLALTFVFMTAFSLTALEAQQSMQQQQGAQKSAQQPGSQPGMAQQQLQGVQEAKQIAGKTLKDQQGQELGKVEALVIGKDQQSSYLIVSGEDQKMYPVPASALQRGQQEGEFQVNITKDQLQQAPSFEQNNWPNVTEQQWQQKVHGYYEQQGQQPGQQQKRQQQSQAGAAQEQPQTDQQGKITVQRAPAQIQVEQPPAEITVVDPKPRVQVETPDPQVSVQQPEPEVEVQQARPEVSVQRQGEPKVTVIEEDQRGAQGTQEQQESAERQQQMRAGEEQERFRTGEPQAALQQPIDTSELEGKDILDPQGEKIGTIDSVIIGRGGEVDYVILSHGGFLGVGENLVPIPWQALQPAAEEDSYMVNINKDQIENAPKYSRGDDQPDFQNPEYKREIHGYYGVEEGTAARSGAQLPTQERRETRTPQNQ
jgi:sporulation protein YlmC with PRC-barrel domain